MIYKARNCFRIGTLLAALSATIMACASAQTTQGTISGYTYGPDGRALGGTTVWANIVSPLPRPVDRSSALPVLTTVSGKDGSFSISGMPAGDYVPCATHLSVAAP